MGDYGGGSGVSQKRAQLRLGDDLQGWKQTSGFGSRSLLFGNYGEVRKDTITYKVEAFNWEYVKAFTRKAAGALEALEEGLMGDPGRISRVAPDSRSPRDSSCQAAAPGWASGREPGRGSERQCAGSQLCLRKSGRNRPHGPRATDATSTPLTQQRAAHNVCGEKGGSSFRSRQLGCKF